jgi:hypothetical protein
MPRGGLPLALVSLSLVVAASSASAGPFFRGREGTPAPGRPRVIEHSHARAGKPLCVSPHATPTNGPGYLGYYVGGGTACRGCSRGHEEGTWGWDYEGVHLPRRVWLSWSHGRRYQGGTGSYRTDGASLPGQAGHGTPTPAHAGP